MNPRVLELLREFNALAEADARLRSVYPNLTYLPADFSLDELQAVCDRICGAKPPKCIYLSHRSRRHFLRLLHADHVRNVRAYHADVPIIADRDLPPGAIAFAFEADALPEKPLPRALEAMCGIWPPLRGDGRNPDHPAWEVRATPAYIDRIERDPKNWSPTNPYYVKSHVNAPGTVRSWFRTLRAADFARDTALTALYGGGLVLRSELQARWTLFDTQQIVDRETARTYLVPTFAFRFVVTDTVPPGCIIFDVELWRKWLQEKWDASVREVHGNG